MTITNPVLYWRDKNSKSSSMTLEQIIADTNKTNQIIQFESGSDEKSTMIESLEYSGDENTVEEPEISADGDKTLNKQNIGALPEGLLIRGHVDISEDDIVEKIRTFARMLQTAEDDFEYGIFGFYSNISSFFDIDPTDVIGYTLKPPTVIFNSPKKQLEFSFKLLLGGVGLT